jgi:hypothetical protein
MSAETLAAIAVALGAGWASGLNTYAAVLVLGVAQRLGLRRVARRTCRCWPRRGCMGVAAMLFALNFLADKIPYVDSINDALQTFVRIPAGFLLAYGSRHRPQPGESAVVAGLLGGTLAAGTHIAKTGSRALINGSPEPFSNVAASFGEDMTVIRRAGAGDRQPDHFSVPAGRVRGRSSYGCCRGWSGWR